MLLINPITKTVPLWIVLIGLGVGLAGTAVGSSISPLSSVGESSSILDEYPLVARQPKNPTVLTVQSTARGAQVLVDGIYAGDVNKPIRVRPGVKRIEVTHPRYYTQRKTVKIVKGRGQHIRVELQRKPTEAEILAKKRQKLEQQRAQLQAMRVAKQQANREARLLAQEQAKLNAAKAALQKEASQPYSPPPKTFGAYAQPNPGYPYPQQRVPAQPQQPKMQNSSPQSFYAQPNPGYQQVQPKMQSQPQKVIKKPRKKKKRRRDKKPAESSASSPLLAQPSEPPPRKASDYMLSLLPGGLPQMRHGKPVLGLFFFALQAGGAGTWATYQFYMIPESEKTRDGQLKTIQNRSYPSQQAQQQAFDKKKKEWEDYIEKNQRIPAMIGLAALGVGYGASVIEALVMGPKPPKTPLEKLMSSCDEIFIDDCDDQAKKIATREVRLYEKLKPYRQEDSETPSFLQALIAKSHLSLTVGGSVGLRLASGVSLNWHYSL